MSKFILDDKDFDSVKGSISNSKKTFEIISLDKDECCLLEHVGDSVGELLTLTKKEWKLLKRMLTGEE